MPLTPEQLRAQLEADIALTDAALQAMLTAAYQAIDKRYGPLTATSELHSGDGDTIILGRPTTTDAVDSVTIRHGETETLLADDDWELQGDGRTMYRLLTGTSPAYYFGAPVAVVYTPTSDSADRDRVARQLVELELLSKPGVIGFTEGNWSIQFSNNQSYTQLYEEILGSLGGHWAFA